MKRRREEEIGREERDQLKEKEKIEISQLGRPPVPSPVQFQCPSQGPAPSVLSAPTTQISPHSPQPALSLFRSSDLAIDPSAPLSLSLSFFPLG